MLVTVFGWVIVPSGATIWSTRVGVMRVPLLAIVAYTLAACTVLTFMP